MATDRRVTFLIGANIQNFTKGLNKAQRSFEKFGRSMERMGSKLTRNVTAPLVALGGASVKSAIDFESAFAGVRKTVDATETEFANLRKGILDMSKELPTSANEIAGVAEAAGQLGIRTDAILDFSRTMVMLGDTTNIAADEAATALARIANVMQIPQDQFDEMGSVIVDLGNNFATTESEIVDFAQRIAGAGQIAGLAASDIFGIATAMTSVGVEAGLGGTAVQKVMLAINEAVATGDNKLKTFAETAGVSAKQFETMWRDDAAQGFAAFVNGLGRQGDDASGTLRELGLADQRLMRAFLSLANAGDLVNRTLDTGTEAWQENTALTKEAEQRYNTIASRLSVLKNRIIALGISIGDALMPFVEKTIEFVGGLTESFENMSADAKTNVLKMAALFAAGGPILLALGKFARAVSSLSKLVFSKFSLIVGVFALTVTTGQWLVDNWDAMVDHMSDQISSWALAVQGNVTRVLKTLAFFGRAMPGAVGGANAAIDEAIMQIQGLRDGTEKEFTGFGESGKRAFGMIQDSIMSLLNSISGGTGLSDLFSIINEGFQKANKPVEDTIDSIEKINSVNITDAEDSVTASLENMKVATKDFRSVSEIALDGLTSGWDNFLKDFKAGGQEFERFMAQQISGAITSFSASVGKSLSGVGNEFETAFEKVISLVADFAVQLGGILIAIGSAMAFTGLLSGPGAAYIAVGAALVAIGTGVSAGISKRASNRERRFRERHQEIPGMAHGGVIPPGFPNDTFPAMLSSGETVIPAPKPLPAGMGGQNINLSGEFRVKGTDLVLSLEQAKKTFR